MKLLSFLLFAIEILNDRFYDQVIDGAFMGTGKFHQSIHGALIHLAFGNVDG
ncbi:MAG: hypothetical protein U9Q94_04835 [Candidatus Bipolaricaulota bacterium]|nr:hypothetical protein [Candidatus Bipolaricaulota bacterium]